MNLRLKYIKCWVDKKTGRAYARFRRRGHPEVMLQGAYGSPEFMTAYHAAIAGKRVVPMVGASRTIAGSLNALISDYMSKPAFLDRQPRTQAGHRSSLERWRKTCGDQPVTAFSRAYVNRAIAESPSKHVAKNWLKAVRPMMEYAVAVGMIAEDPTAGVKVRLPKSDGHHCWIEDEIAAYEAKHPVGTRARLALDLLLYTGQRRGDIVRLGRKNVTQGNKLTLVQEKTGATVSIPILPALKMSLAATPEGLQTFLVATRGKAFTPDTFNTAFRGWCAEAGLPAHCTPHGLRKAFCRRLANAGKTPHEIAACTGHKTLGEVERYCREFNREQAAERALAS